MRLVSERDPVPDNEETPLWEWRETMQPRLARLEAFEVPGFPLDYSRESLDLLEAEVLDRYPFDDRPGSRAGFTEAAMGYLGEALLNVAGGHWEWDEGNDMPVAHFDPELHLAPISPLHLIVEAGQRRTGKEFVRVLASLEQAVADRRAVGPSWSPTKEPTPGLLQAVVLDHLKTLEDFDRPEHQDLIEGAVWYLGEVFRRETGAYWRYYDGEPNPDNPYVGRPFVERLTPREDSALPHITLQAAVLRATPGYLRERLAFFKD